MCKLLWVVVVIGLSICPTSSFATTISYEAAGGAYIYGNWYSPLTADNSVAWFTGRGYLRGSLNLDTGEFDVVGSLEKPIVPPPPSRYPAWMIQPVTLTAHQQYPLTLFDYSFNFDPQTNSFSTDRPFLTTNVAAFDGQIVWHRDIMSDIRFSLSPDFSTLVLGFQSTNIYNGYQLEIGGDFTFYSPEPSAVIFLLFGSVPLLFVGSFSRRSRSLEDIEPIT